MAESKSDEYASKINDRCESSSSVHLLTALENFLRSECRRSVSQGDEAPALNGN
jgi:hypothetical protein